MLPRTVSGNDDGELAAGALMARSREGDQRAFEELYRRHRPGIWRLCLHHVGDPGLAEDLTQETFERAFAHIERFDPGKELWPWLATIARHLAIDALRTRREQPVPHDSEVFEQAHAADAKEDDTFEAVVTRQERERLRDHITASLDSLVPRDRSILMLRAAEGWTYEQIADLDGASVNAIRNVVWRSRIKLRRLLKDKWQEEPPTLVLLPGFAWLRSLLRTIRDRTRSAAFRVRRTLGRADSSPALRDGLLAGGPQLSMAALTLAALLAGNPSALSGPEASRGSQVSAGAAAIESHPAGGNGASESGPRPPAAPGDMYQGIEPSLGNLIDPHASQTPDTTSINYFALSSNYEEDHTIVATGSCHARWDCRMLYASSDGGATWRRLSAGSLLPEYMLLLSPGFPSDGRMYAIGPAGLQESVDGGRSFRIAAPPLGSYIAIPPRSAQGDLRVLIGGHRVFEYRAGQGVVVPSDLPVASSYAWSGLAFSPTYPADPAIFVSTMRSDSHSIAGEAVEPLRCNERLQCRSMNTPDVPAAYRCEASSCREATLPDGFEGQLTLMPSPAFERDSLVYARDGRALLASSDGGITFRRLDLPLGPRETLRDLVSLPKPGSTTSALFATVQLDGSDATAFQAILRSDDGGQTWERLSIDLPGFRYLAGKMVATPTGRLLVAGGSGLACSEDFGATWAPRCSPE